MTDPHPANPRLVMREDVIEQIASQIGESGFQQKHAIHTRRVGERYQILSGHHRFAAATRAGLTELPAWVERMDDDRAYMELVLSNAQGELSPLEIGMHALHYVAKGEKGSGKKGGLREYARRVGRDEQNIRLYRKAAEVVQKCGNDTAFPTLLTKSAHLSAIHALPGSCWGVAVDAMLAKGWSAADTKHWVDKAREFDIPEPWQSVFLPIEPVLAHFFATREFSPATVRRLCAEAERVEAMLAEFNQPVDEWREWLASGIGGASWDVRKLSERGREIENELQDAKGAAVWHLGNWREHLATLADGSVSAIVTDPPYGVNYQSDHRLDRRIARKHKRIENDDDIDRASDELRTALIAFMPKLKAHSCVFVFCGWTNEAQTRGAITEAGLEIRNSLVWVKNRTGMGDPTTTFAPMHERIIFAVKGSPKLIERMPDVLLADRPNSKRHPTEKPADLIERLISVVSVTGDLVADPFGGVASTVAAAEACGRFGWGCEIDQEYHSEGAGRLSCQGIAQTFEKTGT